MALNPNITIAEAKANRETAVGLIHKSVLHNGKPFNVNSVIFYILSEPSSDCGSYAYCFYHDNGYAVILEGYASGTNRSFKILYNPKNHVAH